MGTAIFALVIIAFFLQINTGFTSTSKLDLPVVSDGCKNSEVATDICIRTPKNIPGCSNTLDSAKFNCEKNPPVEP
ncbi:hypothetical protein D9M68_789990 [compost metagenome]